MGKTNALEGDLTRNIDTTPKHEMNWEYHWGDSPLNNDGKLLWLEESNKNQVWEKINKPSKIPVIHGMRDLWVKLRLNNFEVTNTAIFINRIEKIFEVYLDTNKIYSYGKFSSDGKVSLPGFAWHLIKLPPNSEGKTLFFRIRSDAKYIGFYSEIRFGSEGTFLTEIVKSNLSKTILGLIFVFAGLGLFTFLLFAGKIKPFLGVLIFMTTSGIWTLANSNLTQILFYSPKVIYYADHLSLIASAIGFFMLVVEIIDSEYKKLFTRFYQLLTAYLIIVAILDITGLSDNLDTVSPFLIFTSIAVIVLIYFIFISTRKGNKESKILLIAFAVYALFALLDIINYFRNVVFSPDTYEMQFAHFGGFCFLVLIGWILVLRYIEMNKQMLLAQVNERSRIARDLHDEVGPRLTEIKMVSESFNSKFDLTDEEKIKIEELSFATDKVVSTFGEIVWALNPTNDTLEEFASYLSQSSINFLQKANIKCRIDIPLQFPQQKISYDISRNILMAVKESLNNIVKHADASLVTIQLKLVKNDLLIEVADDGHGFDKTNTRKYGNGLTNIETRIKNIGGICSIDSKNDNGTIIKVKVPLRQDNPFTQTGYLSNDHS